MSATTNKVANPGPLGLLGFGMTTVLLNLHNADILNLSIVIVAMGIALGGLFLILGHDFPALLGFKGGKGILSGVTVGLMLDWRIGLFVFGIFLAAYFITGYVSVGSVLSSGSFGIIYAFFHRESKFPVFVGLFLSALIVWMHRGNIQRLIKGEERKTNLFGGNKK